MNGQYHPLFFRDTSESVLLDESERRPPLTEDKSEYASSECSYETLVNEDIEDFRRDGSRRCHRSSSSIATSRWTWFAHAVLLTASISFCIRGMLYAYPSTAIFVDEFSIYSPAAVAVEYEDIKFDGNMSTTSPYVGANPAVDLAWQKITYDIGDQMISAAELRRIDKSPDVLMVTDFKTGVEGYRAGLEVFHQLRCLNLLRKSTFNEYYARMDENPEAVKPILREHLDQCLEILRMNLQCQSDIGLVTFHNKPGTDDPSPDFSTWHTCRKFDKVQDWAMKNAVSR